MKLYNNLHKEDFAMSEFIRYVLYELKNSLVLVLLAGIVALAVLGITYFIYRCRHKGEKKFPWRKAFLWLIFLGYMMIVIYATMLRWAGFFHREWNLHLFRAWREAWNNFSVKNWANVLLNVAMFGPLGCFLPLLGKKFRKWYLTIPAGFGTSLAIELLQLAMGRGICDVDDLFCNTLGAVIGYLLVMSILSLRNQKGSRIKPVLVYGGLCLALMASLSGIFITYRVKEYGNLPQAAAYTNNTKDVTWKLECEFPKYEPEMAVYQTQTRSHAACDAFAEKFKKIINTEYHTVSYYQEAAYYMDNGSDGGAHFLYVNYLDPGYAYSALFDDDAAWIDSDRLTVEAALSQFPVLIPETAEFVAEGDGWHTFTARQHMEASVLIDGTLRVRLAEDGSIREIQNQLLSYTYYDKVGIIPPEDAYQLLCAGKFNDSGYFEHLSPSEVSVLSCTFGYEIDTKGFYQPVYYFEVASPDGAYEYRIMIPAMK